jgi:hypothetical protein
VAGLLGVDARCVRRANSIDVHPKYRIFLVGSEFWRRIVATRCSCVSCGQWKHGRAAIDGVAWYRTRPTMWHQPTISSKPAIVFTYRRIRGGGLIHCIGDRFNWGNASEVALGSAANSMRAPAPIRKVRIALSAYDCPVATCHRAFLRSGVGAAERGWLPTS